MKQSNRWLQWAFIEAAIPATVGDSGLRKLYEQYCRIKGAKIAKVIIARRLVRIVYQVLCQRRVYYANPATARARS